MNHPKQNSQKPPKTKSNKPQKWLLLIFKAVFSILLPYLLSPPVINIHVHHINIMF